MRMGGNVTGEHPITLLIIRHGDESVRELMITRRPRRYKPLVALLRSGLRRRVMIVADGEEWQRTGDRCLYTRVVAAPNHSVVLLSNIRYLTRICFLDAGYCGSCASPYSLE